MKNILIALLFSLTLFSCQKSQPGYDIYLCIGQSNMAGRGPMDATVQDTLEGVYLLTNDNVHVWERAANPLNKYSTVRKDLKTQKVGPAYGFAQGLSEVNGDREIGLVVNAKGGSSIRVWHPDSLFFKEAVRRTRLAMNDGQLKGIIWHQGCSDAGRSKTYMAKLEYMVSELRRQLGEDVPFVVGQLSFDKASRQSFNEMILEVPEYIPTSAVVLSEGLSTIDDTHFDAKSQVILGRRYAAKMLLLQGE